MIEFAGYKIYPIFAWYDLWVGCYWDRKARKLYVLPLPTVGVVIEVPWNIYITTRIRGVDSVENRMFNSLQDARLYVKSRVGNDAIISDSYRITSRDGNTRIIVTGCSVEELLE